jgi:hypothetical protein
MSFVALSLIIMLFQFTSLFVFANSEGEGTCVGSEGFYDSQNTGRTSFSGPSQPTKGWFSPILTIAEIDNKVYGYGYSPKGAIAVDAETGSSTLLCLSEQPVAPVFHGDELIFIGTKNIDIGTSNEHSEVYALNSDSTTKWKVETDPRCYISAPIIIRNETLYVYASGELCLVDIGTGMLKWKTMTGEGRWCGVAVGPDDTIYAGSNAYHQDGRVKWNLPIEADSWPVVDDNSVTYIIGYNKSQDLSRNLYAVNPDGSLKWVKPQTEGRYPNRQPSIGWDGTIFMLYPKVKTWQNNELLSASVVAIDPSSGGERWSYDIVTTTSFFPLRIDANNVVYAVGNNQIHAINADGSQKWTFELDQNYYFAFPIRLASFPLSGVIYNFPITFASKGTFYLNTVGGCYAILESTPKNYNADFNLDLRVDFQDIVIFVDAYIYYYQDGTVNPICDLSHDGKIDNQDITLFVDAYIEYWTQN